MLSFSDVLRIIFLELFNDLIVVFLDSSDIAADTVNCLLDIVVGVEDAVLIAETI